MSLGHSPAPDRIFGLDLMRASAIVMVLLGHLTWILPAEFTIANLFFSLLGFFGVEVFFVLSGFLIGKILLKQFTAAAFGFPAVTLFLKRRWFRTLPNYFLALCANVVIAFEVVGYKVDGLWRYFFFLQNAADRMPAFFPESWSLAVEEFAYLLLPFALLVFAALFRPLPKKRAFLYVVLVVYAMFIASKIVFNFTTDYRSLSDWNLYLKGVVLYRVDAICTGVLFAWLAVDREAAWREKRWLAGFAGFACLVMLVGAAALFSIEDVRHHLFWNVLFLPLLSLSVAGFLPLLSAWWQMRGTIGRGIRNISLISYSLYLLHYGVVLQLLHHFALPSLGWACTALLYFALSGICAAMLYRWFEKPVMDLRE